MIFQFLINGLITGILYALIATGFSMVYNTTRIFHIAFASIYMIAPYLTLVFQQVLNFHIIISVIIAVVFTGVLGICIDFIIYKPLIKSNGSPNVIMISSIGLMIVVINIISIIFGSEPKILNSEISSSFNIGSLIITFNQLIQLSVSSILLVAFYIFLKYTKLGVRTRAYRDDKKLLSVLGVNINSLRLFFFALSSIFAAVGSCLVTFDFGMNPFIGMPMLLNAVVVLIIGGVGRFDAPVIGGILLGVLQSVIVYFTSAKWQEAITFTILILFLTFRPWGLIGEKKRNV